MAQAMLFKRCKCPRDGWAKCGHPYWYRFRHRGQEHRGSTGCTNTRRAEKETRRIRADIEAQQPRGRVRGVPLCVLEELDIKRAARRLGQRVDQRRPTIEGLWRPLYAGLGGQHRDAGTLHLGEVMAYIEGRRKTVRGQTVKREIEALRRGILEARRHGILRADPVAWELMESIRFDPPNPKTKGKLWPTADIAKVLDNLSRKAVTAGHLDRCRVIMLTGLRLHELHRLTPGMVTLTPGDPWFAVLELPSEAAKWGHARTVPLPEMVVEMLERWASPDRPTYFPTKKPNKSLALASTNAGFSLVLTPRDLRVWYLNAVERVGGATAAQWLGGHTNIATTGLYLKPDQRRALTAAHEVSEKVGTRGWAHAEF